VLLLEHPQTLHGFFRKDAPHFIFVLGLGEVGGFFWYKKGDSFTKSACFDLLDATCSQPPVNWIILRIIYIAIPQSPFF
jgi:hypothetical protein